jgi:hypothetical protein
MLYGVRQTWRQTPKRGVQLTQATNAKPSATNAKRGMRLTPKTECDECQTGCNECDCMMNATSGATDARSGCAICASGCGVLLTQIWSGGGRECYRVLITCGKSDRAACDRPKRVY